MRKFWILVFPALLLVPVFCHAIHVFGEMEKPSVPRERMISGVVVDVDTQKFSVSIQAENASPFRLFVDPYATVIWKHGDYADAVSDLAAGDSVEAGYFSEEGRPVAGWIDVLGE